MPAAALIFWNNKIIELQVEPCCTQAYGSSNFILNQHHALVTATHPSLWKNVSKLTVSAIDRGFDTRTGKSKENKISSIKECKQGKAWFVSLVQASSSH